MGSEVIARHLERRDQSIVMAGMVVADRRLAMPAVIEGELAN
jgi:hypothetical protein